MTSDCLLESGRKVSGFLFAKCRYVAVRRGSLAWMRVMMFDLLQGLGLIVSLVSVCSGELVLLVVMMRSVWTGALILSVSCMLPVLGLKCLIWVGIWTLICEWESVLYSIRCRVVLLMT